MATTTKDSSSELASKEAKGAGIMTGLPALGFIGIGTINSAVVRGLFTSSSPPASIVISPRNAAKAELLRTAFPGRVTIAASNQEVVDKSDWVFIATPPKPEVSKAVLGPLKFTSEQIVISLIAGITPTELAELCGATSAIVQAFPLPPCEHHQSTTVMTPKHEAVEAMFQLLGKTIAVDDFKLAMKIGVMSCVMGNFYQQQTSMYEWLCGEGLDSAAATTAVAGFCSTFNFASLQAAKEGKAGFQHLVDEQTPGGLNEQVIRELTASGDYSNLKVAMSSVLKRMTA